MPDDAIERCRVWVTDTRVHYSKRPCAFAAVRDGMCTRHANLADKWNAARQSRRHAGEMPSLTERMRAAQASEAAERGETYNERDGG